MRIFSTEKYFGTILWSKVSSRIVKEASRIRNVEIVSNLNSYSIIEVMAAKRFLRKLVHVTE